MRRLDVQALVGRHGMAQGAAARWPEGTPSPADHVPRTTSESDALALDQILAGHLGRNGKPEQAEHRRREVGETAVAQAATAASRVIQ